MYFVQIFQTLNNVQFGFTIENIDLSFTRNERKFDSVF